MADFAHQPHPKNQPPVEKVRKEEDLTHRRHGPLGDMTVVPDGYAGPMPPGAINESEYQRMVGVYGRIDSGESQVKFDTSNFFQYDDGTPLSFMDSPKEYLEAMVQAAEFKQEYMHHIQDLVKTPAGLQLLETLDHSKHSTTIQRAMPTADIPEPGNVTNAATDDRLADNHGNFGKGTSSVISVDPNALLWDGEMCATPNRFEPWMKDRPKFGFYHELVHAYHNSRGDVDPGGDIGGHSSCGEGVPQPLFDTEFQTVGLGPYAASYVSENKIREQMGVPLRPTYSGVTYDQARKQGPYDYKKLEAEEEKKKKKH